MQAPTCSNAAASADYLCIDFGRCNVYELSEMSRRFTDLCMGRHVGRAMLKAGDNDPAGHLGLRSSHAWRASCQQCHAPSAALDQRTPGPAEKNL